MATTPSEAVDVDISLTARSKARYYGSAELRRRVLEIDGTLFRDPTRGSNLLRTERGTSGDRVVIVFTIEGSTISIITQTSDHYSWATMDHIVPPIDGI